MADSDNPNDKTAKNLQSSIKKALQISYDLLRRNSRLFSRPIVTNRNNHKK